jgi:Fe-S-cluster formation regulator IscX/YfhJ
MYKADHYWKIIKDFASILPPEQHGIQLSLNELVTLNTKVNELSQLISADLNMLVPCKQKLIDSDPKTVVLTNLHNLFVNLAYTEDKDILEQYDQVIKYLELKKLTNTNAYNDCLDIRVKFLATTERSLNDISIMKRIVEHT